MAQCLEYLTLYTHLFSIATPNLNWRKTNFNQFVITFGLIIRISPALAGIVGWLPMDTRGSAVNAGRVGDAIPLILASEYAIRPVPTC